MPTQSRQQPTSVTATAAHLGVLDGLRGLAVLIVLASHFSSAGLFGVHAFYGVGKSGVYLFFVLSAFLLTRNLLRQPAPALRLARFWMDYALRRVLRIWPLYLVVLLASWLCVRAGQPVLYPIDTASLWGHLTLREGTSVLWSIPVEFTFYLWLPLIALGLIGMARWRLPAWSQLLVFGLALLAVTLVWPPAESVENGVQLWPYMAVFLCGAFAARVDAWLSAATPWPMAWALMGLATLLAWCVVIPVIWCWLRGIPFEPTITRAWYLFFGLIWSVLLLALLHGAAWLRRAFTWAPLRWIGLVSFSLYLWHMPVLQALQRSGWLSEVPVLAPVLVLAAALAAAGVSYLLFERPLQRVRIRQPQR